MMVVFVTPVDQVWKWVEFSRQGSEDGQQTVGVSDLFSALVPPV